MTTSPLARPEAPSTWLDAATPSPGHAESSYLDGPDPTDGGPQHDLDEHNLGRSAVAYVLPSPTGKPLRFRTYLALHEARADSAPAGREASPPEAPGSGLWQDARQPEVPIHVGPRSPVWSEHAAEDAAATQEYYHSVFELPAD